jgi:predicted metal-dependent enzyme (double-stranded beta helix superfamily)
MHQLYLWISMKHRSSRRIPAADHGPAPPGEIHRVHNTGQPTAISVHIYGTDITRIGSSARRYYD